mgnify:CR=1 FL=1
MKKILTTALLTALLLTSCLLMALTMSHTPLIFFPSVQISEIDASIERAISSIFSMDSPRIPLSQSMWRTMAAVVSAKEAILLSSSRTWLSLS